MISYNQAQEILDKISGEYKSQTMSCDLSEAVGRICACDVIAPISVQPFDNSAMDGFAVLRSDLTSAGQNSPVFLKKLGIIAAGDNINSFKLAAGSCIQVMTGAQIPEGADAIVPVEQCFIEGGTENLIRFVSMPSKYAHIRFAGQDFKRGDFLLHKGQQIETAHIMPLAVLGIPNIQVFRMPRAVFLATGRELVDDLSAPLKAGEIYNSNRPYAVAAFKKLGIDCAGSYTIPDDKEYFRRTLTDILSQDIDIIISSGAVSAGEYDFVKEELENSGATILYHKVNIKPGKPNLLAQFPNKMLYFGLPGNPVATTVGLRFFVYPMVRGMMQMGREKPVFVKAANRFEKSSFLRLFLKSKLHITETGQMEAMLMDGQESFMVKPFLCMDSWAVLPEDSGNIENGDIIEIYPVFPDRGVF